MLERISFQPHYHTMTMSGNSHFLRVADAMAEFIDNSIQACKDSPVQRQINLRLHLLNVKQAPSFIVMMDNGCGMNRANIQDFATYSLDRATRSLTEDVASQSFISKFGVGAKQAGFFLGDRIRILTKTASEDVVREFTLDNLDFEERYRNQEEVFVGDIRLRAPKQPQHHMPDDEAQTQQLLKEIIDHETAHKSFTTVIIKLKPDCVHRLLEMKSRMLHSELAEIYHFHIHDDGLHHTEGSSRCDGFGSVLYCCYLYLYMY